MRIAGKKYILSNKEAEFGAQEKEYLREKEAMTSENMMDDVTRNYLFVPGTSNEEILKNVDFNSTFYTPLIRPIFKDGNEYHVIWGYKKDEYWMKVYFLKNSSFDLNEESLSIEESEVTCYKYDMYELDYFNGHTGGMEDSRPDFKHVTGIDLNLYKNCIKFFDYDSAIRYAQYNRYYLWKLVKEKEQQDYEMFDIILYRFCAFNTQFNSNFHGGIIL